MSVVLDALVWILTHLGIVFGVFGFFLGLAIIPAVGAFRLGTMPPFSLVNEAVATQLWKLSLGATRGGRLHQTRTDEYVMEEPTGKEEPENYWSRIAGRRLGISWERSEEALRDGYERIDTSAMADGGTTLRGERNDQNLERGDIGTFLNLSEIKDRGSGLYVRAGEKLAALKDTDGLDSVNVATDHIMAEEGAKQGLETKWKVIFWLGMAFMGGLGGFGVFYVL